MNGQIDLLTLYNQDKEAFRQIISGSEMWDIALARRNQLLKTHLSEVSKLARQFGSKFGLEEFLSVAGYLHDYGKASPEWLEYLIKKLMSEDAPIVPHSIHGAKYAFAKTKSFPFIGEILGNIILSHHGKLYDNISPEGETLLNDNLSTESDFEVQKEIPVNVNLI